MKQLIPLLLLAAGCAKESPKPTHNQAPAAQTTESKPPAKADHGAERSLGTLDIGGYELALGVLGEIAPGSHNAVVGKVTKAPEGRDWKRANFYLWAEDADGRRLNAPTRGLVEDGRLHLHVSLPADAAAPTTLVFRLRDNGKDLKKRLNLDGTPSRKPTKKSSAHTQKKVGAHTHAKTPHDGLIVRFDGGFAEVKLHDDKGDLEMWITRDKTGNKPLDLPLSARPQIRFVDHRDQRVTLAPRNTVKNEDEAGNPNLRKGATNYFIFPGETGADATWLKGKDFQSVVTVTIPLAAGAVISDELVLQPHTHHADGSH